jgi:hypothetical protein
MCFFPDEACIWRRAAGYIRRLLNYNPIPVELCGFPNEILTTEILDEDNE